MKSCPFFYKKQIWWNVTPKRRPKKVGQHYRQHKEQARTIITDRVLHWNQFYKFQYNRIAIRNQRRRWGSCSSLGNLNFNYKLIFLPPHLVDYVVVHELCHLQELNHSRSFWTLVEYTVPDYMQRKAQLRHIETSFGTSVKALTTTPEIRLIGATRPEQHSFDTEPTFD